MQNILKNINKHKEKLRNIEIYNSTPTLIIEDNYPFISKAYLKCDDLINTATIDFEGDIVSVHSQFFNGIYFKYSHNRVRIINFNKQTIKDNLLFSFVGKIKKITKSNVFFYASIPTRGVVFENQELENFERNENVIGTDDYSFEDESIKSNIKISNSTKRQKPISYDINGLYTHGNQYLLPNGSFYRGYYHYNTSTKKYRTKQIEDSSSINLEHRKDVVKNRNVRNKIKISSLRRQNGI